MKTTQTQKQSLPIAGHQERSPAVVIAALSYSRKTSYDFVLRESKSSMQGEMGEVDVIQIHNQVTSLSLQSSKSSPQGQASIVALDPNGELLKTITPGDWILVWVLPSKERAREVSKKVDKLEQANLVEDGLRFIGRVTSARMFASKNSQGMMTRRVVFSCTSFSELQSQIYYNPYLERGSDPQKRWLQDSSREWAEWWNKTGDSEAARIESIIPAALDIFLGPGPERLADDGMMRPYKPADDDWNQNRGYHIPKEILSLLGLKSLPPYFSSMVVTLLGVQHYTKKLAPLNEITLPLTDPSKVIHKSKPDDHFDKNKAELRRKTDKQLTSAFQPQNSPWAGVPVWNIIHSYINPILNEMFVSLRAVEVDGKKVTLPHITIRQKPFNTSLYHKGRDVLAHTQYQSLPAWRIDPNEVFGVDLGRSNALRFNYSEVHFLASNTATHEIQKHTEQAEGAYSVNSADVKYHGLRMFPGEIRADITSLDPAAIDDDRVIISRPESPPVTIKDIEGYAQISSPFGPRDEMISIEGEVEAIIREGKRSETREELIEEAIAKRREAGLSRKIPHNGIDFRVAEGTPVPAAGAGVVELIRYSERGYGTQIVIDHGRGVKTRYAHLQSIAQKDTGTRATLREGDRVVKGQVIGYSGNTGSSTGPHLHFEVLVLGKPVDPETREVDGEIYRLPLGKEDFHGVTPYTGATIKTTDIGTRYSNLLADMLYERHLALSGTIRCAGIYGPIAVGDNLLYDGYLLHIESISDHIEVDDRGLTTFRTEFSLSNGMKKDGKSFLGAEAEDTMGNALLDLGLLV